MHILSVCWQPFRLGAYPLAVTVNVGPMKYIPCNIHYAEHHNSHRNSWYARLPDGVVCKDLFRGSLAWWSNALQNPGGWAAGINFSDAFLNQAYAP